ncbi:MAG: hypothetical protein QXP98_08375 [Thermoproteus sp.]
MEELYDFEEELRRLKASYGDACVVAIRRMGKSGLQRRSSMRIRYLTSTWTLGGASPRPGWTCRGAGEGRR